VPPFSPGDRVVVIGAGATRGATTSAGRQCLPPLNTDFFTQLQRVTRRKHISAVNRVIDDVVNLFGSNFNLTMEDYFTQLESIGQMTRLAGKTNPAFSPGAIARKRNHLMRALAAVLEESTDVSRRDSPTCDHHRGLVEALNPRDTVISFNYDCVMDHALRRHGDGKWSARYGYCLPNPNRIFGYGRWSAPNRPLRATDSIYLLKLHGSLNWRFPVDRAEAHRSPIRLKERLYQQRGTPRFTIIPPEWAKNIDEDPNFRVLWKNAERAIRNARCIALIGFSFTPTDLHVESLFRVALAKTTKLKTLIIVNPSPAHRQQIRSVFAKPLERSSVVRQYETLEEFATHLHESIW
jgi:SIR2-like domain